MLAAKFVLIWEKIIVEPTAEKVKRSFADKLEVEVCRDTAQVVQVKQLQATTIKSRRCTMGMRTPAAKVPCSICRTHIQLIGPSTATGRRFVDLALNLAHFVVPVLHRTPPRLYPSIAFTALALLHQLKTRFFCRIRLLRTPPVPLRIQDRQQSRVQ